MTIKKEYAYTLSDIHNTHKYHCENCSVLYLSEGYDEFFCSEECMNKFFDSFK